jgi:hypothetical protein
MAKSAKSQSGGGCLHKLLVSILLASGLALALAMSFIPMAQDLTDVGGYGANTTTAPAQDIRQVLKNAVTRKYEVTLTETDINQWLGRTLATKQGGRLAGSVSLDRVWVRLSDGCAEVVMARTILGLPFTVSMFLQIEQKQGPKGTITEVLLHGGPYQNILPLPPRGGRFGKLVVPQGFLLLVMPAYERLAGVFQQEIHLGCEEMSRVKIEQGRIVMDPRDPSENTLDMQPAY